MKNNFKKNSSKSFIVLAIATFFSFANIAHADFPLAKQNFTLSNSGNVTAVQGNTTIVNTITGTPAQNTLSGANNFFSGIIREQGQAETYLNITVKDKVTGTAVGTAGPNGINPYMSTDPITLQGTSVANLAIYSTTPAKTYTVTVRGTNPSGGYCESETDTTFDPKFTTYILCNYGAYSVWTSVASSYFPTIRKTMEDIVSFQICGDSDINKKWSWTITPPGLNSNGEFICTEPYTTTSSFDFTVTAPQVVVPTEPVPFNFSLSNGGNRYIKAGDTVSTSLFTSALASNISGDVKLTIDSIKNRSGISVMNVTNGFTVSSNPFNPKTNIVTLSPTITQVTTPLSFIANNSILPDTYTVNVSGVYTKTVAGTSGSTTNYYCSLVWEGRDYYFGCGPDSNFNPKDDYQNGQSSSVKCIEGDTFGPEPSCASAQKVLTFFAKEQIRDFRQSYGRSICPGTVNVVGDQDNPNTGFTCVVAAVAPVTQTINKTTAFDVIVQPPVANIDYALSITPSPDGCPASSLSVTAAWKAVPNASSYNLYRFEGSNNQTPTATISVNSSPVNGYVNYTDSAFSNYNVLVQYNVAAVVNGVEVKKSDFVSAYTPKLTTNCIPPVTPIVKLFTKKTTSTTPVLSSIDLNTDVTTANDISIYKNEAFDLKWISNLGPNYTCSQVTVLPNGTTNNTRIVYGNTTNGTSIGIAGSNLDTGTNLLKVSCSNGTAVLSNVVRITVLFEPTYNFSVIPSGDQCLASDVWIKQTWIAVPGASSYKISRTGGAGPVNYTIASPNLLNTENNSAFNSTTATAYTYIVTAVIGGVDQIPSAPITIMSPRSGINCPPAPVLKLFTKKNSDTSINLNNYDTTTLVATTNTEISLNRNESFDLKWVSNLDASYTCAQDTQTPGGSTNNTIWQYGNSRNGASTDLRATSLAVGLYNLKVSCTNGTGQVSNVVKVTVLPDPIVYGLSVISSGDQCLSSDVWINQTWLTVPGASSYKISRTGGAGPISYTIASPTLINNEPYTAFSSTPTSYTYTVSAIIGGVEQQASDPITILSPRIACPVGAPVIKMFIRKSSDTSVNISSFNILSALNSSNTNASVKLGQDSFDLKWVSNLGVGYTCSQVTTRPGGSSGNGLWDYGAYKNGAAYGLGTSGYLPGAYTFSVSCTNGATTVVSNVVDLTIVDPLNYKLSVVTSGDQCLTSDIWMKQTWSIISNATAYKITRTGGAGTVTYNVPATPTQNIEPYGSFNGTPTAYTYTISAIVGGVEQLASVPVTVTSPKVECPIGPLVIKLFTRKSTDATVNFSTYTTATTLVQQNSDIVVTKGQEYFDLKWMSSLDNSYVCTQVTTTPTGTTNNALWSYGAYPNGTVYWQGTGSVPVGVYRFKVSCTKGASTVESNTVNVNIVNPINYNFVVAPSANQCDISNLQIRLTWSLIPGATSYRITRTEVSTGQTSNYAVSNGVFTQSFAGGTIAFVQGVDYTYKVVAMANGVAIAPASPTVVVRSPSQDTTLCSTLSLRLEVKKSTESNTLYRSAITLNKGENFDIRWTIVNPNGSVYMNSNSVVGPQGINGNGLWVWGSGSSGSRTGLSTTPLAVVAGDYIFKMDMMDTSTGSYVLALSSNSAKVTINSTIDVCPNLPGIQTVVPDAMVKNSAGNCVVQNFPPTTFDPDIKIFIAENDTDVISYNSLSTPDHSLANRKRGDTFGISWVTNLPAGYVCEPQTEDSGRNSINYFPWNRSGTRIGSDLNGYSTNLQTTSANPDTYSFYMTCIDSANPLQYRQGNVVKMALSDIATDPDSVKLFIGSSNILSNNLSTPLAVNPTYKIKKGNRFNILWASNLNNSYECTANTKKSDGIAFSTWDWNPTRSKGDKTTNLTTGNVEKGIYSFQLFCSDPAHDPANPDKQSNIVKLQVVESTIIEQ
ncbi:hypothetical protein EB001_08390 [bacterium]|nr:hypothetical protein [bacterium]